MLRKMLFVVLACVGVLALAAGPAAAQYGPDDTISVTPGVSPPGGPVTVTGSCFLPGSEVTVTLYSDPVVLGTLIADDTGTATGTFTLPAGTTLGEHTIELTGTGCDGAPLTLVGGITVASASTGVTTTGGSLPQTGSNSGFLVAVGATLIAAGAMAVLITRKRQEQEVEAS